MTAATLAIINAINSISSLNAVTKRSLSTLSFLQGGVEKIFSYLLLEELMSSWTSLSDVWSTEYRRFDLALVSGIGSKKGPKRSLNDIHAVVELKFAYESFINPKTSSKPKVNNWLADEMVKDLYSKNNKSKFKYTGERYSLGIVLGAYTHSCDVPNGLGSYADDVRRLLCNELILRSSRNDAIIKVKNAANATVNQLNNSRYSTCWNPCIVYTTRPQDIATVWKCLGVVVSFILIAPCRQNLSATIDDVISGELES